MRRATSAAVGAAIEPVTISPAWVIALYLKFGMVSHRRDAQHFGRRGDAGAAFGDRILDHGGHAGLRRGILDDA